MSEEPNTERRSLLIVEDSIDEVAVYRKMFKESDYEVTVAFYEGDDPSVPERVFDRAIFDGLGGRWREAMKRINARKKILISGEKEYTDKAEGEGITTLPKPVRLESLLEALL